MRFKTVMTALLAVLLLSGCSMGRTLDALEDTAEQRLDAAGNALEDAVQTNAPAASLTKEQAQAIALEHAGFTADQVTYLRAEYEIDDRLPEYEVHFHQGGWEYDYEINAQTGEILSYDRDT